ncbi:MAG: hypothetical protein A2086_13780 [Spirochaetes bacterium GWD1_27_9]|nr:MAG: hypothetical protein A2Z98_03795 [Spirochaetes bacterium GWB1_27_13]OHD28244.1 MAG: hypothetical protein A2Y34_05675 [Spirochaetes bacterium GWC1_27_15]OHD40563.1 MAG: hypothetical protein A2086_13780 [Spirochaetes bacterium GWD1_27_9]
MQFFQIIFIPLVIFLFSLFIQNILSKENFFEFFKMFAFGIIAGLIINFVTSFFNPIFMFKANYFTIFIKSFLIDGLLFSLLFAVSFYFVLDIFCYIDTDFNFSITSILSFAYLCGIFIVLNIVSVFSKSYLENIFSYLPFLSVLIIVSLIVGFGYPNFINSKILLTKISWGIFTVGLSLLVFGIYWYLRFFNFIEYYIFIAIALTLIFVFEKFEFNNFRQKN